MYLGIDLGTSAIKLVVLRDGAVFAQAGAALSVSSPQPGWSEQAPGDWWQALRTACAQLDLNGIRAVGLSGQMHGAVLLGEGHEVLRPCILWNDNRSAGAAEKMQARCPDVSQRAGVLPLPGFTAPKLTWLRAEEPENWRQVRNILLPKDYIGLRLHGGLATDRSDAAGTLWLNQATRGWDDALCAASDTDPDWLPPLFDGSDVVGQVTPGAADALGLPPGIPVVAGGGDAATGALSVGAVTPGVGFISLGTSGQLFVCSDGYQPNPDEFVHAFAHTLPNRWYQMAAMLNGARPLAWFAGVLGCDVATLLSRAEGADATRVPLFLPFLTGERSPHGDPDIRATFYGLDDATGTDAMCRAVVEAVAFSMADACQSFGATLDGDQPLLAIGGGARSDLVLQSIADATGQVLVRAEGAEAGPACGAALLAQHAVEGGRIEDVFKRPSTGQVFEPTDQPALMQRLHRYRALYQALRPFAKSG
ncbi:MAG: xylulokinase [Paracoccaceae bacterium]|nr:xylulokinase [Paracoccaceae bacterium]